MLIDAEVRTRTRRRAVAKTGASLAFVIYAYALGAWEAGPAGRWVVVGLALSVVGDLALLSRRQRLFLAGLAAFLLAHLAYIGAFLTLGVALPRVLIALAVLALVAAGVWRWLGRRVDAEMRRPVLAYVAVISVMLACSLGALAGDAGAGRAVLAVAAAAFYLSDLCVARDRFVAPGPLNRVLGLPLYYGAQLLFGLGVVAVSL